MGEWIKRVLKISQDQIFQYFLVSAISKHDKLGNCILINSKMCIGFICSQALPTPNTHNTLKLFKIVFQYTLKSHTQVIPRHHINSSPSGMVFWYWHSINLNIRSRSRPAWPQAHWAMQITFATAIIKVHSPHSFLSFFFDQSKHCSRGTFAFPYPYPQADTKVPSETEHKHSEVAVTQGRLVWELREPCALPARLREAHVRRSKRVPQQKPNSNGENPNAPRTERAHTGGGCWRDQACSPVNSNGGYSWQVEEVNFPADPSMTVGKGSQS